VHIRRRSCWHVEISTGSYQSRAAAEPERSKLKLQLLHVNHPADTSEAENSAALVQIVHHVGNKERLLQGRTRSRGVPPHQMLKENTVADVAFMCMQRRSKEEDLGGLNGNGIERGAST
jgi:hypothetical protein